MAKSDKEKNKIKDEFDEIQSDFGNYDMSAHLAMPVLLPDLGEIQMYDYDSEMEVALQQARIVIESLVDLYLGDVPALKKHSYIKNKIEEDAKVYAETIFLSNMTRKAYLTQMRQVDNGENSARMHEVLNQTVTQIRDNVKFTSTQRTELEKFYKGLRKDLGLQQEIETPEVTKAQKEAVTKSVEATEANTGLITDNRKLNDIIANALLKKDEEKNKKTKKG